MSAPWSTKTDIAKLVSNDGARRGVGGLGFVAGELTQVITS